MSHLQRMHHRQALDLLTAVPENREFINGIIRYLEKSNKPTRSGSSTLYGYNIFVLDLIMARRPNIVSIAVCKRLDVVKAKGRSDIPKTQMPKYYPERYKIEGY